LTLQYLQVSIRAGLIAGLILLNGCATPAQRLDQKASAFGYKVQVVTAGEFDHRVYRNRFAGERTSGTLHVYLDGDGTPWVGNHGVISADPTPHSPLMLELMALDDQPAIYVGRPCYHGYATNPACTPMLWTDARYSERVVDSMAQVLRQSVQRDDADKLVLFGHSGGGVLAVLLANRLPQTSVVVTLAANLDIDAWADLHGYSRLVGSLNPAAEPSLDAAIAQLHLVGSRDSNVPLNLLQPYLRRQPDAQVVVMPGYNHVCCWRDLWPKVLAWVAMVGAATTDQRALRFLSH
jgi:pimeloyl-ACP methyl ester carboxylesterase